MDERVSMDALKGTGEGKGVLDLAAQHFRRGEADDGTQPFAPGEDAVAHGRVDGLGARVSRGRKRFNAASTFFWRADQ